MVGHVLTSLREGGIDRAHVVVGHRGDEVAGYLQEHFPEVGVIWQAAPLGPTDAVLAAVNALTAAGDTAHHVLVVNADLPLLSTETVTRLRETHLTRAHAATVVTARVPDPAGYGRVVRDTDGLFRSVVEDPGSDGQEVYGGIQLLRWRELEEACEPLAKGGPHSFDRHVILDGLSEAGHRIGTVAAASTHDVLNVNSPLELNAAGRLLNDRLVERAGLAGVLMPDPASVYLDSDTEVGTGTVLHPGTRLRGATQIGRDCEIGPYAELERVSAGHGVRIGAYTEVTDSVLGNEVDVHRSVVDGSTLGDQVRVGPFAYIRPGTVLDTSVKIGSYAELKKTSVGRSSTVAHFSYLGDTEVGREAHVGGRVGTANAQRGGDGRWVKSTTVIGDGCDVGAGSVLIAPLTMGPGSATAAGSLITTDIPAGGMGYSRAPQHTVENWTPAQHAASVDSASSEVPGTPLPQVKSFPPASDEAADGAAESLDLEAAHAAVGDALEEINGTRVHPSQFDAPLSRFGADSLTVQELSVCLEERFHTTMAVGEVSADDSIQQIGHLLYSKVGCRA